MSASARRGAGPRSVAVRGRPARIDVSRDGVLAGIGTAETRRVAALVLRSERRRDVTLSVTMVSEATIRRLNRRFLGRRATTDVIAFGMPDGAGGTTGDIYIAPAVAARNARARGLAVRAELARLVVHGVLHVLGYDHPDGAGRTESPMWRRQEALVARALRNGR